MVKKKFYLVDDCTTKRSCQWRTEMIAEDGLEAVKEMWREWDSLTPHDREQRDNFYCISEDHSECYTIKVGGR